MVTVATSRFVVAALAAWAALGCGSSTAPSPRTGVSVGTVQDALMAPHRGEENRARDTYRHPEETLALFGLEPHMTVIELWPGRGWYTEVLAPVLRGRGQLVAATMDPADATFRGRFAREYRTWLAQRPDAYDRVRATVLFPGHFELGPDGSADLVVSFRSLHNWIRWGNYEAQVFAAVAKVLRPGGVFGIVQHRAALGADARESAERGYVPEAYVIELARVAGLELVARSEINANARDGRDHPEGVWSLPPTLRGGDVDRERFVAIGESDRMTLRFEKPRPSTD